MSHECNEVRLHLKEFGSAPSAYPPGWNWCVINETWVQWVEMHLGVWVSVICSHTWAVLSGLKIPYSLIANAMRNGEGLQLIVFIVAQLAIIFLQHLCNFYQIGYKVMKILGWATILKNPWALLVLKNIWWILRPVLVCHRSAMSALNSGCVLRCGAGRSVQSPFVNHLLTWINCNPSMDNYIRHKSVGWNYLQLHSLKLGNG